MRTSASERSDHCRMRRAAMAVVAGGALLVASSASAQERVEAGEVDNVGPRLAASGGAYFPDSGSTGGVIDGQIDYGLPAGPFVIAPGARVAGYMGDQGAITGDGVLTIEMPIGVLVPYVQGGLGIGHATGPSETGASLLADAGLNVHLSRAVSLGARGSYETVTGTPFRAFALAPQLAVNF